MGARMANHVGTRARMANTRMANQRMANTRMADEFPTPYNNHKGQPRETAKKKIPANRNHTQDSDEPIKQDPKYKCHHGQE